MWESTVDGRKLNFHLAGINNQNFIMQDEETGSWWQQVTGEAILGPLKGRRLQPVTHDEITFGAWKREKPAGRVLRPDQGVAAAGRYVPANWEEAVNKLPVTVAGNVDSRLAPRDLVVGVTANRSAKAYPFSALQKQNPIVDVIGGVPVLILLNEDERSVRAYDRSLDGRSLEFFMKEGTSPLKLVDAETGSEWEFTGAATSGPLVGKKLDQVTVLEDYWFDWVKYHPETTVYSLGKR